MKDVVIVSAVRTAIGSFGGSLCGHQAVDLGAAVIAESIARAGIDTAMVEEVIMGNVLQAGLGMNPARTAALKAGLPQSSTAFSVNKVCGSGLKSVALAAQAIRAGDAECVIAGGMESMSNAPFVLQKARWGLRMGAEPLQDVMLNDGLVDPLGGYHMGITAENVAKAYGITREEQDAVAFSSQQKAAAALLENAFAKEILPITVTEKKQQRSFDRDEYPRATNLEKLAALRPAFQTDGTVTAGNASGLNDGAAALVVMSAEKAKHLGLSPIARIVATGTGGVDPALMGVGPVPACRNALQKAGWQIGDVDLVEANEAFAAQFIAVGRDLGLDMDKTNVNGGAIALGHPIGASGARILVTLLHGLERRGATTGLATLCIGGGQGIAMLVERI